VPAFCTGGAQVPRLASGDKRHEMNDYDERGHATSYRPDRWCAAAAGAARRMATRIVARVCEPDVRR